MTGAEAFEQFIERLRQEIAPHLPARGDDVQFVAVMRDPGRTVAVASSLDSANKSEHDARVLDVLHRAVANVANGQGFLHQYEPLSDRRTS